MRVNLKHVEAELERRGFSTEVRNAIRNARICIVDDHIQDLKGLTSGLRNEGFTNLVEIQSIGSVDDLLAKQFDLIILDLTGVAGAISESDGFGVLEHLKNSRPMLPVLVVTGTTTPPSRVHAIKRADLIRSKPVKALELVTDVEQLLRPYKDQYWAALEILKEIRRLDTDLRVELSIKKKLVLWWQRRALENTLVAQSGSAVEAIITIGKTVSSLGSVALKLTEIADKFSDGSA